MILLPQLFNHASQDLKSALYAIHYGLGRHYKIQAVKPKEDMNFWDMAMEGKAIMFTIQQTYASFHLKTNNDILQVFAWFYEKEKGIEIQTVEYGKYDIFVLMKQQQKPIEVVAVKEADGHVLEYVPIEKKKEEEISENEEGI
jgi:hypothetical protein